MEKRFNVAIETQRPDKRFRHTLQRNFGDKVTISRLPSKSKLGAFLERPKVGAPEFNGAPKA